MHRLSQSLLHRVASFLGRSRAALVALTGVRSGAAVVIGPACEVALGLSTGRRGAIELGPHTQLERGVLLHPYGGRITTGTHVFLGPGVVIYGHGSVTIGDGTLVAMHCRIVSSNHTIPPLGTDIRSQPDILRPTRIGRDVWLGAGVTVLGGVTIGDGCVVGAGSVVTKDLPPGTIAHGIPAVVRGRRPDPSA